MTHPERPKLYTIPAGIPFVDALARGLLEEYRDRFDDLTALRILLPTRRAGRALRDAFLRQTEGRPLLLPRLLPLGDIDEDDLPLDFPGLDPVRIPPALSPIQRRCLLARTLLAMPDYTKGPAQALALAEALGRLMDQIHTEGLALSALPALADGDFARHWQITLDFLKILAVHWPAILAEYGAIDATDRRNRMIEALTHFYATTPPSHPVLAAGSTGSIPAIARLLAVIAALPLGRVVLPGLDQDLDEQSWEAIDETHPQAALKSLLKTCHVAREDVILWQKSFSVTSGHAVTPGDARRQLAREMTRPAETSGVWQNRVIDPVGMDAALKGLHRYDLETPQEEALTIAVLLRETLETPGRTAVVITPDRLLARRIAAACRRWDIALDDSGGQPLSRTALGVFLLTVAQAAADQFAPVSLLAALRHDLASGGMESARFRRLTRLLDARILRGPAPNPGWGGLRERVTARLKEGHIPEILASEITGFLSDLERLFSPLTAQDNTLSARGFAQWVDAHLAVCEGLAAVSAEPGAVRLWRGPEGEAAATFFSALREAAPVLPALSFSDYPAALGTLMESVTVRPAFGAHPRLAILGQLEARLVRADRVILAGLNEGIWPPGPDHDPWMSRPMRRRFGLPGPERSVGLSAHDFVGGFCAPEVFLTRALKADGAPTVPSRWLQRLDVVLQAQGLEPGRLGADGMHRSLARRLDAPSRPPRALTRPAPTPPVDTRPRRLSVTRIETWLKDPYSIYARSILKLKKLDPADKAVDLADRGTLLHAALSRFTQDFPDSIPDGANQIFLRLFEDEARRLGVSLALLAFWAPRARRIGAALTEEERRWRKEATFFKAETQGLMTFAAPGGSFILSARADRIDRLRDGAYALIDYKSGGSYSKKAMAAGDLPQLPMEALILENGGFPAIHAGSRVGSLAYWIASGRRGDPLEVQRFVTKGNLSLSEITSNVRQGFEALIRIFDDADTPYYSVPRLDRAPRFNDYEHLARLKEWAALDDPGDTDSAEATE